MITVERIEDNGLWGYHYVVDDLEWKIPVRDGDEAIFGEMGVDLVLANLATLTRAALLHYEPRYLARKINDESEQGTISPGLRGSGEEPYSQAPGMGG